LNDTSQISQLNILIVKMVRLTTISRSSGISNYISSLLLTA